jgi:hypothetical protein
VQAREALPERIRLGIDDEVDFTLAVQGHVLGTVARDGAKAHLFEQLAHRLRVRRGELDELEAVGAHWVFPRGELHGRLLHYQLRQYSLGRPALNFKNSPA